MLRGVILGILRKVAMCPRFRDILYDLWPLFPDKALQFFLQRIKTLSGQWN
jgi:hypothetical protein